MTQREYKIKVKRNGTTATLYVHTDDFVELTDPDTDAPIKYLQDKMKLTEKLVDWSRKFGVKSFSIKTMGEPDEEPKPNNNGTK